MFKKKQNKYEMETLSTKRYNTAQKISKPKKIKKKGVDLSTTSNGLIHSLFESYDLESSIMELEPNLYSITFSYVDISFAKLDTEDAIEVFTKWRDYLNSVSQNIHVQITNANTRIPTQEYKNLYTMPLQHLQTQEAVRVGRELNEYIDRAIGDNFSTLENTKYITFSVRADNLEEAKRILGNVEDDLTKKFKEFGSKVHKCSIEERLQVIWNTINYENYAKHFKGQDITNINYGYDSVGMPMTVKDILAPSFMNMREIDLIETHENEEIGSPQRFIKVFYASKLPTELSPVFYARITHLEEVSALTTVNIQPVDNGKFLKQLGNQLMSMKTERLEKVKRAGRNGYDYSIVADQKLEDKIEKINELRDDILQNSQKIFECNFIITVIADTEEEIRESARKVYTCASESLVELTELRWQQFEGLKNCLPLGWNDLVIQRALTSESASLFTPFYSTELQDKNGLYMGLNLISKKPIFFDRKTLTNQNALIAGTSGSGKSYLTKLLIEETLCKNPNDLVIIIDPQSEYSNLVSAFGGTTIYIDNSGNSIINPFDLDGYYSLSEGLSNPVSEKSEFLMTFLGSLLGSGTLTGIHKSIIDRVVRRVYEPAERMGFKMKQLLPNLETFYTELLKQPETEAQQLAKTLERFVQSKNLFNGITNVNMTNNFICFDIHNLPSSIARTGYLVVLDFIMQAMNGNKTKGRSVHLFADEFHIILSDEETAKYFERIYRLARKFNVAPTVISQQVEDIAENQSGIKILQNSETAILLKQKETNLQILQEIFSIPETMTDYLTDTNTGEGLLIAGQTVLPYQFKTRTDGIVYELNNTSGLNLGR